MKVLIVIANFGNKNDHFRDQLIAEYQSLPYETDIHILSNIPKNLGNLVEVHVGCPSSNPWSLPFAHKQIFVDNVDHFDLFIYSEDDTLITAKNITVFLEATKILPEKFIAGFLRYEFLNEKEKICSTMHSNYHWDIESIQKYNGETFAYFSNEHAGSYILTKNQLKRAITSRGFLVKPYEAKYDMLVTAATDPYTSCGMQKLICISRIDEYLLHHLPNVYSHNKGRSKLSMATVSDLKTQITQLLKINGNKKSQLINDHGQFPIIQFEKTYFSKTEDIILKHISTKKKTVLSIGCGDGSLEREIINNGLSVTAVPLDPVIGCLAKQKNVEIKPSDFKEAYKDLKKGHWDYLLFNNILQYIDNPEQVFIEYKNLLNSGGIILVKQFNYQNYGILKRLRRAGFKGGSRKIYDNYHIYKLHKINNKKIKILCKKSQLVIHKKISLFSSSKMEFLNKVTFGVFQYQLSAQFLYLLVKKKC